MANLNKDELVLLKEVFNITLIDDEYVTKAASRISGYNDPEFRLTSSKAEIESKGGKVYLSKDYNLFENIIVERLNISNTEIFQYLSNCMDRVGMTESKAWNQTPEKLEFFKKSKELITNYFCLTISTPE